MQIMPIRNIRKMKFADCNTIWNFMSLLEQHHITKIEGHGTLNISFKECRARLEIEEGERLFEALLIGRPLAEAPFITSRICGVCPVAHSLASIKALEDALGVKVSEETIKLRKILLASQIIQSHALHLFFLSLPDYIGVTSALELHKTHPQLFNIALKIKSLGDNITTIIGGRNVHPITAVVGGFSKTPSPKELRQIKNDCQKLLNSCQKIIKLFASFKYPYYKKETTYLSLVSGKKYEIYDGKVESSQNYIFDPHDFQKEIKEKIKPYSTAKFAFHDNKSLMVGAIARISLHQEYLNPLAKSALKNSLVEFPIFNSFYNNLAQAVEILHFVEEIIKLCDELILSNNYKLPIIDYKLKAGEGVGAIEAPRGTLYHHYEIDTKGLIKNCDIVTPTVQNLANVEEDAAALLKKYHFKQKNVAVCIRDLEMLIRAYDPCITCSVH